MLSTISICHAVIAHTAIKETVSLKDLCRTQQNYRLWFVVFIRHALCSVVQGIQLISTKGKLGRFYGTVNWLRLQLRTDIFILDSCLPWLLLFWTQRKVDFRVLRQFVCLCECVCVSTFLSTFFQAENSQCVCESGVHCLGKTVSEINSKALPFFTPPFSLPLLPAAVFQSWLRNGARLFLFSPPFFPIFTSQAGTYQRTTNKEYTFFFFSLLRCLFAGPHSSGCWLY